MSTKVRPRPPRRSHPKQSTPNRGSTHPKQSTAKRRSPPRSRKWQPLWSVGIGFALIAAVGAMLFASRSPRVEEGSGAQAPPFTLPSTNGDSVSLAEFRGKEVLLYFSEGVGCDTCFYQMRELEENATELSADGLTVLPIVVNPADQVRAELDRFGLTTPYLIDADESVSDAYGVLGTGMHENLPGHSFILVDGKGRIAWRGDYPSMFVATDRLLSNIRSSQ